MRHVDWMRVRITPTSDQEAAQALLPQARLQLGEMMEGLKLVDQRTGLLRRRLPDGSTITASFDGTTPLVEIDTPTADEKEIHGELHNLWIPRGIVVYPAWTDAKGGVGLPIVPDTHAGSYAPENLAPGLDRSRWTPGGPCGEVLLSPDEDAGYPQRPLDIVVPLLFHPSKGPVFRWSGDGAFDARAPRGTWRAYRIELNAPVEHYADESAANAKALFEQINAYRVAQGATKLNLTPRGYYHAAQVMCSIMKETGAATDTATGYPPTYKTPADRLTKDGYPGAVAAGAYVSFGRGDNVSAYELRAVGGSASSVLAGWQADPTQDTQLVENLGPAAFADVGFRDGFWCANLVSRARWIEAGNMGWQSADATLPPLTWMGFASLNLAWETFPCQYDVGHYTTAPLVPLYAFTNAYGDCWMNYPRSTSPLVSTADPAMGRHVYCRGRSIAMAPRGGLVWGACIQAFGDVDRLIALVHHPEDQPADYTHEGWTRYLRVWWCDLPRRRGLRADPQMVLCGEDAADPWSWRGGELVDVGHMPPPSTGGTVGPGVASSLKMASQWRFSGDGRRAVCLRDYGPYADYSALYAAVGVQQSNGMRPRAVELTFDLLSDATTTTVTFHDYTAGLTADVRWSPTTREHVAVPLAVDFDAAGRLTYVYAASTEKTTQDSTIDYVGSGPASVRYAVDMSPLVTVGANRRTTAENFQLTGYLQVLDVGRLAFVAEGMRPRFYDADGGGGMNPAYASCWPFTSALVHGARAYLDGTLQDESWYPMPDSAIAAPALACYWANLPAGVSTVFLPLAMSANVQAYWAQRFGQHVLAYQCSPVPAAVRVRNDSVADGDCGCMVSVGDVAARSHFMARNEWNPRGGKTLATIPLPANDWLIYAKVA